MALAGLPAGGSGSGDLVSTNNLSDVASAATAATNLGLGTGSSPQLTAVNIGHATDTTLARSAAGKVAVEGKAVPLMAGAIDAVFTGPTAAVKTYTLPDADSTILVSGGALGTPASGTLTNCSGTAASLTAGTASAVAVGGITGLGSNIGTALAVAVGTDGAPVVKGGALGTPTSGVLTGCTGTQKILGGDANNYLRLLFAEETIAVGNGATTADGAANFIQAGAFIVGVRVECLVLAGGTTTMGVGTTVTAAGLLPTGSSSLVGVQIGGPGSAAATLGLFGGVARTIRITFNGATNDANGSYKVGFWYFLPTVA